EQACVNRGLIRGTEAYDRCLAAENGMTPPPPPPVAPTPPAGVEVFRDEFGHRYDGQGNRLDDRGNIINPQAKGLEATSAPRPPSREAIFALEELSHEPHHSVRRAGGRPDGRWLFLYVHHPGRRVARSADRLAAGLRRLWLHHGHRGFRPLRRP